jgi:hypothetical protein
MSQSPKLLSNHEVRTFLIYPPSPQTDIEQRARHCILTVKQDGKGFRPGEPMIEFVVRRLREEIEDSVLEDLFTEDTVLVPAPGSAPLRRTGGSQLWPTRRVCDAMVAAGFGREVAPLLKRIEMVPKSAFVRPGEQRPGPAQHARTIEVATDLTVAAERFVIVDDVLTRGATMLGCASRLAQVYPDVEILGFALARTSRERFEHPIDPAVCNVSSLGGMHCDCRRMPQATKGARLD